MAAISQCALSLACAACTRIVVFDARLRTRLKLRARGPSFPMYVALVKVFYEFDIETVGAVDVPQKNNGEVAFDVIFDLNELLLIGSGVR